MIEELLKLDDAALAAKLGFEDKVKDFKDNLVRAQKLDDKGKAKVEAHLKSMFTPHVYSDDLKYAVDRAERKEKTGCSPCEVVSSCCPDLGCD